MVILPTVRLRLAAALSFVPLLSACPPQVPDEPPAPVAQVEPEVVEPAPVAPESIVPAPSAFAAPSHTIEEAVAVAARGEFDRAESMLLDLVDDPESGAWASYNLGAIAFRRGRQAEAIDRYEQALLAQDDFAPALVALVRVYVRGGDLSAARRAIDLQLSRSESAPEIRAAALYLAVAEGRHEQVIRDGREILLDDEGNLDVFYNMAVAYLRTGRPALAEYIVDQALGRDATRADFPLLLAQIRLADDNLAGAQSVLQNVLALDPYNAEAHNNLGLVRLRSRNFARAAESFEAATRYAPDYAEAWLNLGNARKGRQDYDGAQEAFERALAVRPDYADPLFNLGVLYLDAEMPGFDRIERLEKALDYFAQFAAAAGAIPPEHRYHAYRTEAQNLLDTERELREQAPAVDDGFGDEWEDAAGGAGDGGGDFGGVDDAEPASGTSDDWDSGDDWGSTDDWGSDDDWGSGADWGAGDTDSGVDGPSGAPEGDDWTPPASAEPVDDWGSGDSGSTSDDAEEPGWNTDSDWGDDPGWGSGADWADDSGSDGDWGTSPAGAAGEGASDDDWGSTDDGGSPGDWDATDTDSSDDWGSEDFGSEDDWSSEPDWGGGSDWDTGSDWGSEPDWAEEPAWGTDESSTDDSDSDDGGSDDEDSEDAVGPADEIWGDPEDDSEDDSGSDDGWADPW